MRRKPIKFWQAVRITAAVLLLMAIIWFWLVPFIQELSKSPASEYQQQGDEFRSQGRLPEAVLSYRQALNADPGSQAARSALSEAYRAQGRLRMAARYAIEGQKPALETGDYQPAIWTFADIDSSPTGAAMVDNALLALYEDGTAVSLRLEDGALLWTARLPSAATSAPSADEQLVYAGAEDGKLYALNRQDGTQRWSFATHGPIYAATTSVDGVVYLPSSDGNLYALRAGDGSLLWKFATRGALHSAVTVSGGRVVFGSHDARVYALDAASGAPAWQDGILTNGAVENQPAVIENRIILGSGDGRVYALALDSGGQFWRASTPDAVYAAPVVVGGVVYIASSGKTLSAIDLESGKKLWQAELPGSLRNPPVIAGDSLYFSVDADAGLYRVDATSGAVTRLGSTGDWVAFGPWIAGERLFVAGKDGALLAFPLPR